MLLTTNQRFKVWAAFIRQLEAMQDPPLNMDKHDIRAAMDYYDDYIEAEQANINAGTPQPFRSNANLQQKTLGFCFVAMERAGLIVPREE